MYIYILYIYINRIFYLLLGTPATLAFLRSARRLSRSSIESPPEIAPALELGSALSSPADHA